MRLNEKTTLLGNKLVLIPYKKHHVEKYHKWMQNTELLEQTASEPLTLKEEYEMQHKWWQDEDKCTFILLSKTLCADNIGHYQKEVTAMVGDVNLFFNNSENIKEAEVEVMIAEQSMRGQGLGKEAVAMIMYYGFRSLQVEQYTVKIGFNNLASIKLFMKLGFKEISRSEVFQEITYKLDCKSNDFINNIINNVEAYFSESEYTVIP